jgi:HK97 family phage major capsid protein
LFPARAKANDNSDIGKNLDHRVTRRHSGASVERATASLLERNAPGRVGEKEVLFYTTKRVGGGVQDFDAIKLLKFGTS